MPEPTSSDAIGACVHRLRRELLAEQLPAGYWTGELSPSALSTATAVSALATMLDCPGTDRGEIAALIRRGVAYLDTQQNDDGGYGDTDRSHSNIATSYLVLAARTLASDRLGDQTALGHGSRAALRDYIAAAGGIAGLRRRYGKDKTFVVPILTNLAIAGLVDWGVIPRLPFEVAVFPGSMYRFLRMPVVSYAIPALVAMGQVHHICGPPAWWPIRRLRAAAVAPTMRVLAKMQPDSGGYLEATPLTSFVLMSLAASGRADHPVSHRCLDFIRHSIDDQGAWPIDTNLATWVTSLSIAALAADRRDDGSWFRDDLVGWHLSCQHLRRHPFTGAAPGGWGWTDLSGAVPDGDDTPAAILAIGHYMSRIQRPDLAVAAGLAVQRGLRWLCDLQNRDGGLPTFCRGWGKLPFDRSSTDLTAHFVRAIDAAASLVPGGNPRSVDTRRRDAARRRAIAFLKRTQQPDGCWLPLWFGNQDDPQEENPVYGTGRVLLAIANEPSMGRQVDAAVDYLLAAVNPDGGWGGGPSRSAWLARHGQRRRQVLPQSSLEETAVAVEALAAVWTASSGGRGGRGPDGTGTRHVLAAAEEENRLSPREQQLWQAIIGGAEFLVRSVAADDHQQAWPIGFYFAKLWYHERLYPLVLSIAALSAVLHCFPSTPVAATTAQPAPHCGADRHHA